jgi:hypothetical protein
LYCGSDYERGYVDLKINIEESNMSKKGQNAANLR